MNTKKLYMLNGEMEFIKEKQKMTWNEEDLKEGDWVYTPGEVFGSGGKDHNIFQYDPKINYSLHFGHDPVFYKLESHA